MPDYGKKTVADLQEILKGRSLPHTGKKAELVARLNEADKSDEAKTSM
jgi:SAP domain-containing ribonucleoprotein